MGKGDIERIMERIIISATDSSDVDMNELERINIFLDKAKPFLKKQPYDIGEPPHVDTQQEMSWNAKNIRNFKPLT